MKQKLILVRHSAPKIGPDIPSSQWRLSEQGRQRCIALASRLALWQPGIVVSSLEKKAIETGTLVAERMGIPFETAVGLHEHDRQGAAFTTHEHFEADVARFFRHPGKRVFGNESAEQAQWRFQQAVTAVLAAHPLDSVAIATHGTVMTLFVSQVTGIDPFPFWQRLGLPAFAVFGTGSGPGDLGQAEEKRFKLLAVEEHICQTKTPPET